MKKIIAFIFIVSAVSFFVPFVSAQEAESPGAQNFRAKVLEVANETEKAREDGSLFIQQDLKLLALDGPWAGREIDYYGISDIEVVDAKQYQAGDRVFVDGFLDESGEATFYVIDYVRSRAIYWLAAIFAAVVIAVGRFKGFKALLSLGVSFLVIVKLILPQILAGRDPFLVSLLGGLIILTAIIYLTEGWNRKSHLAIASVFFSLIATLVLAVLFSQFARLSGMSQEEAMFLINQGQAAINFQGLLLAAFIIGAIGVLDDIIIGQIEAVEQIREANPSLSSRRAFVLAYKVGNAHLGAIINTLFLTYAGAALPLLLLAVLNQESGVTFARFINTEAVSTEIVRTLVGSIGVILAMPIATTLAAFGGKRGK